MRRLPDEAHGLGEAGGIAALHALHAGLREQRALAHDRRVLRRAGLPLALLLARATQRSGPARPCRTGAPCARSCRATGAPRRRASRRSCPRAAARSGTSSRPGASDMSACRAKTQSVTPLPATVSHSCFARAPPLRGVAGEDALAASRCRARSCGRRARSASSPCRRRSRWPRRDAALRRRPSASSSARERGDEVRGALARSAWSAGCSATTTPGGSCGRGIRARRAGRSGSGGRRRDEGGGAGDQDRGGGKSWHYACYIGPTCAFT